MSVQIECVLLVLLLFCTELIMEAFSGLSLRAGSQGFPPATMNVPQATFIGK